MNEYRDLEILGAGKQPGGRFGKVLIAGAGKLVGSVECEEFSVPGSGKVEDGDLIVHGPLSCYGAVKVEGRAEAEKLAVFGSFSAAGPCEIRGDAEVAGSLKVEGPCTVTGKSSVEGSMKVEGGLQAGQLRVTGSLKTEGPLKAEEIEIEGILKAGAAVEAETFRAAGPVKIEGELNAGTVELILGGEDTIESIVGGSVTVRRAESSVFRVFTRREDGGLRFGRSRPHLQAELIEADEIDLEYTDCRIVRGVNVHVGPECVIDRVEYSGTLTTDAHCAIGEKVKL